MEKRLWGLAYCGRYSKLKRKSYEKRKAMKPVKRNQNKRAKPTFIERLCGILWDLLDCLVSLYMVVLMVVLPLYTTESGYRYIGTEKCLFFRSVSLMSCKVILPMAAVYLICRLICRRPLGQNGSIPSPGGSRSAASPGRNGSIPSPGRRRSTSSPGRNGSALSPGRNRPALSVTDVFALVYLAAVVCSYLHSSFKEGTDWGDTFYGATGWYLGLLTQLLFLGIYFMVSRLWQRKDWMPGLWVLAVTVVTLLGYLNRFGVYPLEMKAMDSQYISTIGNINWYCGYIVTIVSGIAYYLWQGCGGSRKKWVHIAAAFSLGTGLASLVTQGSSSGIVALLILAGVFYLLSMRDTWKLQRFWEGCILLSGVCLITWVIRQIWPQAITYSEGTTDLLTLSPLPFFMMGGSLLGWFLVHQSRRAGRFRARAWSLLGIVAWAAAGAAVMAFVILLAVNTGYPGSIGALSGLGAFTFDASWGSNRGITWTAGLTCFMDQDIMGKFVGVGPDAMALYIHSGANPALKQMVEGYFGRLMLTNAHNEWLTVLINEGLLGAVGYIGFMITAICRYLKAGRTDALAGAAGMGILAYTVNNIFSFQQVMGTSAVFLLLGIGEACLRGRDADAAS